MLLTINNVLTFHDYTPSFLKYCNQKYTFNNPDYMKLLNMGKYVGNTPKTLSLYIKKGNDIILPFGCIKDVFKYASSYNLEINDLRPITLHSSVNLRDYQKDAIKALKMGKNGVLISPCGSGKTVMGLNLIKEIGGRALWLTHTSDLLTQSLNRAKELFGSYNDFGTITAGKVNLGKTITFATVQTLSKIDPNVYRDYFDVIIVDECHRCIGTPTKLTQFAKVLNNINCRYKYGLTATPERSDNLIQTLFSLIGPILYTIDEEQVKDNIIKAKHVKVDVKSTSLTDDLLLSDGRFDYNEFLNLFVDFEERNLQIRDMIVKHIQDNQLVLAHRVEHLKNIQKLLNELNIPCALIDGKTKKSERNFNSKIILATYQLAKEGLDIPQLNILHLISPQKNNSTTIQSVGRIERNIEGKETPIVYDYVDINIPLCLNMYKKRKRALI